jgi:hypothetical protein
MLHHEATDDNLNKELDSALENVQRLRPRLQGIVCYCILEDKDNRTEVMTISVCHAQKFNTVLQAHEDWAGSMVLSILGILPESDKTPQA